jgi:hypothetical protein
VQNVIQLSSVRINSVHWGNCCALWLWTLHMGEIIAYHQCGFWRNRSATDQIGCIRQILEKEWEYNVRTSVIYRLRGSLYIEKEGLKNIFMECGVQNKKLGNQNVFRLHQQCSRLCLGLLKHLGKLSHYTPWRRLGGGGGFAPTHSCLRHYMGVSGQRHALAALYPRYPLDRRLGGPQNRSGRRG